MLAGRVVVVTGAGSGIGYAISEAFAERNATVLLLGRDKQRLDCLAGGLKGKGLKAFPFMVDMTDINSIDEFVGMTQGTFRKVDVLVNCAGTNLKTREIANTEYQDWQRVISTNLTGAFYLTKQMMPLLRAAEAGLVANISSIAGDRPKLSSGPSYCASKAALNALTEFLNLEANRFGIRAASISPGEVDTEFLDLRPQPPTNEHRARILKARDVAEIVVFVAMMPSHVNISHILVKPTSSH
jgi:NADP-dependent 3-hydroxy acid dehydrogenase YdfG